MKKNLNTILYGMCAVMLSQADSLAQITLKQDYANKKSATIGTFQGVSFREAGFSGLYAIPHTNGKEFWTVSDRGVNVDAANANKAIGCIPTYDKIYGFPNYAPKIHRIRINGDSVQILQTITIKRPNGTGATGLLNPTGFGSTAVELPSIDTVLNCANFASKQVAKDVWGIDSEGIIVDKDGNFWLCEEGGPTIWKVAPSGVVLKRYTPYANLPGAEAQDIAIDSVFKYRKNNRGFEGITMAPNGKIYAAIQSPLLYPSKSVGEGSRVHRILEIDPSTNATRMFAYLNDGVIGSGSDIRLRDWKLGDLAAINDTTFLVLEAALRGTKDVRRVYKISLNGATQVTGGAVYGGKTLEALVDESGLTANGIVPMKKTLVMDLLANGWPVELEKAEGLAIINDSTIAIANDNDYGQTTLNGAEDGVAIATTNLSHVFVYELKGANKLVNFRMASTTDAAPSTSTTPYILPVGKDVKATAILTVGDDVNGYKMAGIPDGLGAYDNNDGTFSLLMNHEHGNTVGVTRAHGIKGAFVSKWVINKNDLSVVSGKDLIKSVYDWDATNQISKVDTSIHAFNRFCSADLPAPTALYNSKSGKGTQEKVFMNGEESGTTGYAMAHVASGPNEGKSYVLGKFALTTNGSGLTGVGGWENILLCPFEQDKTVAVGNNDGGTGIMNNSVVVYVGTKTTTGTEADKAGLTNGVMKFVNVAGNAVEIADATTRATNIKSGTAFTLSGTTSTVFSRPEDGAWDPKNPSHFYFVTTDRIDQVMDGIGTQIGRSRLWRLKFTDITNPDLGGTIDMLLDGTEGQVMFDNMTIDNYGHALLQEDVGNAPHNGKLWQYSIAKDELKMIAMHDESRFGNIGKPATAPFNQDEETSGIIDMSAILGAGNFLLVDQAHYATTTELVEGGQLIKLFNPDTYAASLVPTGVTSSATPYIIPVKSGVDVKAVLTVGDDVNGYKMAGIPDGLGAYDNNDGTFSLLMNHEHGNTVGVTRAHGIKGAFVSKWVINKNDLTVVSGKDLIKSVYDWDATNQVSKVDTSIHAFNRFCSADLPAPTALYNSKSGKGTQEKVFMNGEESGTTGYAMAHVASGPNEGKSYVLGKFALTTNGSGLTGVGGWENILLCPFEQDKTVAVGNNDGGTGIMNNSVVVYVGTKTTTGTEADKAGLTNGAMQFVNVVGNAVEIADATTRATNITSGTAFTLSGTTSTTFSRPEDGAWDPKNPSHFYFVTTDRIDLVNDAIGTQIGRSRLWRLNFTDITNPNLGGTIDMLLDGTEGQTMFDNMTIDNYGHVLLLEDVGNNAHNGKVWQYTIATDALVMLAKHDEARFGNVGVPATAPFNQDEETSGIIDMEHILGAGNFLLVDQAHYATNAELVEGGQLIKLFNPDTYAASQVITGFDDASNASSTSAFTLFPNPTNNEATLSMMVEKGGKYVVSVRDMKGNEVLPSIENEYAKGQNSLTINTTSLSNGIYFVQISNGSTTTRIKTVVIH